MINSFIVEIEQGKVKFKSEHHKELFARYVMQFPDGKYNLEINKRTEGRSQQQNRYYWLYLGIVSRESGHTTEELHQLFRGMFLSKGIKEVMGKPVRVTKSTTELSKNDFCEYLAEIYTYTEIPLPDTSEFLGYSYHEANYRK